MYLLEDIFFILKRSSNNVTPSATFPFPIIKILIGSFILIFLIIIFKFLKSLNLESLSNFIFFDFSP